MASVVREQHLSNVWTVEYALELLFIGGLVPEAVWLTHKLGDWKTSVSIGLAFQLFCKLDSSCTRYVFLSKHKLRNSVMVSKVFLSFIYFVEFLVRHYPAELSSVMEMFFVCCSIWKLLAMHSYSALEMRLVRPKNWIFNLVLIKFNWKILCVIAQQLIFCIKTFFRTFIR